MVSSTRERVCGLSMPCCYAFDQGVWRFPLRSRLLTDGAVQKSLSGSTYAMSLLQGHGRVPRLQLGGQLRILTGVLVAPRAAGPERAIASCIEYGAGSAPGVWA
jgi:hypothetical protein